MHLQGNVAAKEALVAHVGDRLLVLTRSMFRTHPYLRRWGPSDDVFQTSVIRLHRALAGVKIESVKHFFNFATLQVRRELLDMLKKHYGPEGIGATTLATAYLSISNEAPSMKRPLNPRTWPFGPSSTLRSRAFRSRNLRFSTFRTTGT